MSTSSKPRFNKAAAMTAIASLFGNLGLDHKVNLMPLNLGTPLLKSGSRPQKSHRIKETRYTGAKLRAIRKRQTQDAVKRHKANGGYIDESLLIDLHQ